MHRRGRRLSTGNACSVGQATFTGRRKDTVKGHRDAAARLPRTHRAPSGTAKDTKCLVDERRRLHPISLATAHRYCINDDPTLAREAVKAGAAPLRSLPPLDRQELPFFASIGARPLSNVATLHSTKSGPALQDPHVRVDATLQRLRSSHFASAVAALVSGLPDTQPRRSRELAKQLAQIERIEVVDGINKRYRVSGTTVHVPISYWVSENVIRVSRAKQPGELRRAVADAIADLADMSPHPHQLLGDAIYFLLLCRSVSDMRRELERRKIPWEGGTQFEDAGFDDADDEDDESASIAASIGRSVVRDAFRHPSPSPSTPPKLIETARNPREPLPMLQDVKPEPAGPLGEPMNHASVGQPGGGGPGAWSPRNDAARSEDRELGRRGEEIVLEIERERVKALGWPAERVVWTADVEPAADHDIKSVDKDGEDLWIEVKSTAGRDGRFGWSRAEFSLAVRARERYVLYRVYEAHSKVPKWKPFRDPISLFDEGGLQLDLDRLSADVGSLPPNP